LDRRHRQILETIAANAGIAIQNARLYARTDEALARRVQELDSILRASTQGILLLSSEWDVLAANTALANFVDLPTQQIKGKLNESDLITRIGYTDGDLARDCLKCLEAGGAIREVFHAGDNTLERTLVSVRNEVGQVSGWLMIFRDLTEETKLKEMQAELTQTMVHDLRSPLSSMIGYLNLLKFEIQPEGRQPELYFSAMEMLSEQMLDMVNELLDINRLESGDMPLYKTEIALSWLLENAVAAFQSLAEQSEIDLRIMVDPATPTVVVDPDHMQRVVNNLVDNALKYAPEGGLVRLEARGNGNVARLQIIDNGPGIEKSDVERIFQKFHQVTRKPGRRRGSGLGLSYCKLVVEAHDGSISVESEPGQGATFIVDLPLKA
jgi:signal transduction histidine kinase